MPGDMIFKEMVDLLDEARRALNWQGAEYLSKRIETCLDKIKTSNAVVMHVYPKDSDPPRAHRGKTALRVALESMEPGARVFMDEDAIRVRTVADRIYRFEKIRYSIRKVKGGTNVWRLP